MQLVSILVPVYNVEDYVGQCLDSLVNQTYPNIEIIVINDGSTDRSLEIVEAYQKKYSQIQLYSYKNAGVSTTRNRALSKANGDYLMFVDSDDSISLNTIEEMVHMMEDEDCDIVTCGYSFEFKHFKINRRVAKDGVMTNLEALHSLAKGTGINNYPWAKLFKRSCFKGVCFPENQEAFEDAYTIFKAIIHARKIGNISKRYYHYNHRVGSLTNQMDLKTIYRMRESIRYQQSYLERYYPEEKFEFAIQYYNTDMVLLFTMLRYYNRNDHVKYDPSEIDWKQINLFYRIGYLLFRNIVLWKVGCHYQAQEDFES